MKTTKMSFKIKYQYTHQWNSIQNANKWTSIQLLNNSIVKATPQGQMIKPDTRVYLNFISLL